MNRNRHLTVNKGETTSILKDSSGNFAIKKILPSLWPIIKLSCFVPFCRRSFSCFTSEILEKYHSKVYKVYHVYSQRAEGAKGKGRSPPKTEGENVFSLLCLIKRGFIRILIGISFRSLSSMFNRRISLGHYEVIVIIPSRAAGRI